MNIAIVGLGLIGGSIGLAARARGDQVVVYDTDPAAGASGLELGAASAVADSVAAAVADAELAFVCGPVAELPDLVTAVVDHLPAGAVVSDVGSTKGRLMEAVGDHRDLRRWPSGVRIGGSRGDQCSCRAVRWRHLVSHPRRCDRSQQPPHRARVRVLARCPAGGNRCRLPRPPGRAHQPPPTRARQPVGQPGRRGADRRSRPAYRGWWIVS